MQVHEAAGECDRNRGGAKHTPVRVPAPAALSVSTAAMMRARASALVALPRSVPAAAASSSSTAAAAVAEASERREPGRPRWVRRPGGTAARATTALLSHTPRRAAAGARPMAVWCARELDACILIAMLVGRHCVLGALGGIGLGTRDLGLCGVEDKTIAFAFAQYFSSATGKAGSPLHAPQHPFNSGPSPLPRLSACKSCRGHRGSTTAC